MLKKLPDNMPEDMVAEIEKKGGLEKILKEIPTQKKLGKNAEIYKALSSMLRLRILCLLKNQASCVCLIRSVANISYSKLSYHLSILKNAGLIDGTKDGNYVIYHITELGKKYAEDICKNE